MLDAAAPAPPRWELYRILSEPVRLRLLALAAEEELAIGELAEILGESQPNVSRHAAPLRQAGLLGVRREGTRTLVSLRRGAVEDPVIADAVESGRALCVTDGSMARIADVLRARDALTREFFARAAQRPGEAEASDMPRELGAYLAALSPLIEHRALAVDAGTGDGRLLEVLAPVFARVVAVDRAEPRLARARERVLRRGFTNVELVAGDLDALEVRHAVTRRQQAGADAVFASRVLHHAARPAKVLEHLAALARPGGAVVIVDYGSHDDEQMRAEADVWLGFSAGELRRFARGAGLENVQIAPIPAPYCGGGSDGHLPWQVMIARVKTRKKGTDK